jgi:hypothetical protein
MREDNTRLTTTLNFDYLSILGIVCQAMFSKQQVPESKQSTRFQFEYSGMLYVVNLSLFKGNVLLSRRNVVRYQV